MLIFSGSPGRGVFEPCRRPMMFQYRAHLRCGVGTSRAQVASLKECAKFCLIQFLPSRPKILPKHSLRKCLLEAINFVIITKALCVQLEKKLEKGHKNITKIIIQGNYFVIISARMVQNGGSMNSLFLRRAVFILRQGFLRRLRSRFRPLRSAVWP